MLAPQNQFFCDTCDQIIEKPEDGWFEWIESLSNGVAAHGFRICHHNQKCERYLRHPHVSDSHLENMVGSAGLVRMLWMIQDQGQQTPSLSHKVQDMAEYLDAFRRIHVPYYEAARHYWADATNDGFVTSPIENEGLNTFKAVAEKYGE